MRSGSRRRESDGESFGLGALNSALVAMVKRFVYLNRRAPI